MQVVSLAPVPVASRMWRHEGQPWSLAVVCKITVRLEAGTALIAKSHDPIHEQEITAGAVAASRVHAPADLVPTRAGVDVSLVGDAYALDARGPFTARLQIAGIDKTARLDPQGPVTRAPENFAPLASSAAARRSLLSGSVEPAHDSLPLVLPANFDTGYFNSAPHDQRLDELPVGALLRLEHLHPEKRLFLTQLPDVVPQVFVQRGRERHEQVAHLDALWIDSRRGRATMTWRCQVPLTAEDESGRVWVTVAGPGRRMSPAQLSDLIRELGGRDEPDLTETNDDTHDPLGRTTSMRARRLELEEDDDEPEDGQDATGILPNLANSGNHTSAMALLSPQQALGAAPPWLARTKEEPSEATLPAPGKSEGQSSSKSLSNSLGKSLSNSLGKSPSKSLGSADKPAAKKGSIPPPRGPHPPKGRVAKKTQASIAGKRAAPPPIEDSPWSQPGSRTPPRRRRDKLMEDTASLPGGHHALALQSMRSASNGLTSPASEQQTTPSPPPSAAGAAANAPPSPPGMPNKAHVGAPLVGAPLVGAPLVGPLVGPLASPPPPKVMQAQLAKSSAAQIERPNLSPAPPREAPAQAPPPAARPRKRPARPIDLLWFDRSSTRAVRNRWQTLSTELDFAPRDRFHDLPSEDPELARDHHTHFGLLAQLETTDRAGLRNMMQESVAEDGRFTAPLCALKGTLRVSFDSAESLRALVAAMKPFSDKDSKLDSALENASALLNETNATATTLNGAQRRVREAFGQSSRTASIDIIDQAVERALLEQRHYACRTLLGGDHIRATLLCGKHELVCYLDEELKPRLPMMVSFEARIIAEAHPRQDQYETANTALRVLTLGRLIQF